MRLFDLDGMLRKGDRMARLTMWTTMKLSGKRDRNGQ
jgi:hypothetical protein